MRGSWEVAVYRSFAVEGKRSRRDKFVRKREAPAVSEGDHLTNTRAPGEFRAGRRAPWPGGHAAAGRFHYSLLTPSPFIFL